MQSTEVSEEIILLSQYHKSFIKLFRHDSLMIYLTNMNLFTNTHLNMDKLTHKCTQAYKHLNSLV